MPSPEAIQAGSILVVDDDPSCNEILSLWLRKRGHRVQSATDAAAALAAVDREPVELVLLDVMMPGTDGLGVLRSLRRGAPASRLPVIMVTAMGGSADVVRALEMGASDYVTKPLDFPVVLARVETHLALRRATAALEAAHERVRRDLRAAAGIQRSFLPSQAPAVPGVRTAWSFRPCEEVGGDFFNLVATESGRLVFYMLDVSGHGVQAALTAVGLGRVLAPWPAESSLLRNPAAAAATPPGGGGGGADAAGAVVHPFAPPAEVLTRLNRHFCSAPPALQFATVFYGVFDPLRRDVRYVSAGHPWPVRVPARGPASAVETEGFPIGWFDEPGYVESELRLAPGERLYLCSDGVSEARDASGRQFGPHGLIDCLEALRAAPLDASVRGLGAALEAWCGRTELDDDVSVLALELEGV